MERPPVTSRFVPPRAVIGALARFAFWPLAYVGAKALAAGTTLSITFVLILGSLIASSATRARSRSAAGGGVVIASVFVGLAAFGAARAALASTGPGLAVVLAVVGTLGAALSFSRTLVVVRAYTQPALDADALALTAAATWLAVCSALTRFGAEAVHAHAWAPSVARAEAVIACVLAAIALVTMARQRAWTARVYRGEHPSLSVAAGVVEAPPLSHLHETEAAIVARREALDPYREHRLALARVPAEAKAILDRYTLRTGSAAAALGVALVMLATGTYAGLAHSDDATLPRRVPQIAEACRGAPPALRIVALGSFSLLDVEGIAARYRSLGLDARADHPVPWDDRLYDPGRRQIIAEEVARAAIDSIDLAHGGRQLIVVLTDQDMFIRESTWRFAFAYFEARVAVVSLARMGVPWQLDSPRHGAVTEPPCTVELQARAYKMISRQIVLRACSAIPIHGGHSLRRSSVLSLSDLDSIQEDRD